MTRPRRLRRCSSGVAADARVRRSAARASRRGSSARLAARVRARRVIGRRGGPARLRGDPRRRRGRARARCSSALLPRTLVRAVCLWAALGGRSLAREAEAVGELVERDDLPGARRRIRSLVGRDPEQLDATGLSRAVDRVGRREHGRRRDRAAGLGRGRAGRPACVAHRAVNTLDAMVGNRSARYARFGTASARADDVMNWPAARLAAALTVLLSGRPRRAARAWRDDAADAPEPERRADRGRLRRRARPPARRHPRLRGPRRAPPASSATGATRDPADIARAVALARRISLATALLAVAAPAVSRRVLSPADRRSSRGWPGKASSEDGNPDHPSRRRRRG